MSYAPPLTITPRLVDLVSRISEALGRWAAVEGGLLPQLRRENRIRSIHASLAIEANSLTLSQVTDIVAGRRVLGPPREIAEVRNAVVAYDLLESLDPASTADFLAAQRALLQGLAADAGKFRSGGVGVYHGEQLVHMAPPAERVPHLIADLLVWLKATDFHPLLAAAAVHYEIEFIHPFSDGNGRIGRLWQTLILSRWRPQLAFLPVETVVRDRQNEYYRALGQSDREANVAPFAEFILAAILGALEKPSASDPASDPVSDPVNKLLAALAGGESAGVQELMRRVGVSHKTNFRRRYLKPALDAGLLAMTEPDSPNSPTQRYRRVSESE